jgi:tetratricopeptide (TPR) repeat protein
MTPQPEITISENKTVTSMTDLAVQLRNDIDRRIEKAELGQLLDICKRALVAARHTQDKLAEAVALYGLAAYHRYTGQFREASLLNDGCHTLARELRAGELMVDALIQRAELRFLGSFQYYEAQADFQDALEAAHNLKYVRGLATGLIGLSGVFANLEMTTLARNYAREGLDIAREMNAPWWQIQALNRLGAAYRIEKKNDMALQCHQHALNISRDMQYPLLESVALYYMGIASQTESQDEAARYLEEALHLARGQQELGLQFLVWNALGELYIARQNLETARDCYQNMLRVATEYDNPMYEAYTTLQIGRLHSLQSEYAIALDYYSKVLTLTRRAQNPLWQGIALEWMAACQSKLQDYQPALDTLKQARDIYGALDYDTAVRRVMTNFVLTYLLSVWDKLLRVIGVRKNNYPTE